MTNQRIKEIPFLESTLETIDYAMYDYVNTELDLYCTTNDGWKKVDVIWMSAERAYMAKRKRELRDNSGTVNYPLIMINRESVIKDPTFKGTAFANVPHEKDAKGGSAEITIACRINQEKTSNFASATAKRKKGQLNFPRKNKKIVYETISIPMPVYILATYTILLRTQYQEQMNDLVQPFITKPGGINYQIIKRDGHRYEAFVDQDFSQEGNRENMGQEERKYETKIKIKVLGHLIGDGKNAKQPKIVVRENAVEFKIPRERVIMGDIPEHTNTQGYVGVDKIKGE